MNIAEAMSRNPIPESYSAAVAARWRASAVEHREDLKFQEFRSASDKVIKRYIRKALGINSDSQWRLSFQRHQYYINYDTTNGPEICGPHVHFTIDHRGLTPSIQVEQAFSTVASLDMSLADCRAMMDAIDKRSDATAIEEKLAGLPE
jgi:hypothetical protein